MPRSLLAILTGIAVFVFGALAAVLVLKLFNESQLPADGTASGEVSAGLVPLLPPDAPMAAAKLPADAVVLHAAAASGLAQPVKRSPHPGASRGEALLIAEGEASETHGGRATWTFTLPGKGDPDAPAADPNAPWQLWARVYWRDTCSNSADWQLDGGALGSFGEDHVFNAWHWVRVGAAPLADGPHSLTLAEREDGIALDQWLLTRDPHFTPRGPAEPAATRSGSDAQDQVIAANSVELRRFADNFNRSPGHGLGEWDVVQGDWQLAFSFDPNRIPNQYALTGAPAEDGSAGVVLIGGEPWSGSRLTMNINPDPGGVASILVDQHDDEALFIRLEPIDTISSGPAPYIKAACPIRQSLGSATAAADLRPGQWHRVEVERWAFSLRVTVDGSEVVRVDGGLGPASGRLGLKVDHAGVVFDDVQVVAIPWQADGAMVRSIPWRPDAGAEWYRDERRSESALVGVKGGVTARWPGMRVEEILLAASPPDAVRLEAHGMVPTEGGNLRRWLRPDTPITPGAVAYTMTASTAAAAAAAPVPVTVAGTLPAAMSSAPNPAATAAAEAPAAAATTVAPLDGFRLVAQADDAHVQRVAVRYAPATPPLPDAGVIGPFAFASRQLVDPSDYMEFTEDEVAEMQTGEDADVLKRSPRIMQVLSSGHEKSAWHSQTGKWKLQDEALLGIGPNARCAFYREIGGAVDVRLRVRLLAKDAVARVRLHAGADSTTAAGQSVEFSTATGLVPETWHELHLTTAAGRFVARVDGRVLVDDPWAPSLGDRLYLEVPTGSVSFDDVELRPRRRDPAGTWYGFDQREADWWREGGDWIDHGGIACVLASSWIALEAPGTSAVPPGAPAAGRLRLKQPVDGNVALAFDIEENTAWYGWDKKPSHTHFPSDNVAAELNVDAAGKTGYHLVLNGEERRFTTLYRNGEPVVKVAQDANFPIKYVGGHAPYKPRVSRIILARLGDTIVVRVNDQEIIRWRDPKPLIARYPALGGDNTRVNFSHIEVLRLPAATP